MSEVFRVIIEGDYRAGQAFEAIIKQTGIVKTELADVGVAAQNAANRSAEGYEKMARGIWRVTSLFAVMDMAMMRVEVAHNILESAQERYTYAVQEHGSVSRQAINAARELERVQNYVQRSYIRAAVAAGSFTLNMLTQSHVLDAASLAHARKAIAEGVASAVTWFHNQALAVQVALVAGLTFGMSALVAAFSYGAIQAQMFNRQIKDMNQGLQSLEGATIKGGYALRNPFTFETTFNISESDDFDEIADRYAHHLKSEYRRRSAE